MRVISGLPGLAVRVIGVTGLLRLSSQPLDCHRRIHDGCLQFRTNQREYLGESLATDLLPGESPSRLSSLLPHFASIGFVSIEPAKGLRPCLHVKGVQDDDPFPSPADGPPPLGEATAGRPQAIAS